MTTDTEAALKLAAECEERAAFASDTAENPAFLWAGDYASDVPALVAALRANVERLEAAEAALEEWCEFFGCDSPKDCFCRSNWKDELSRMLKIEQSRANVAEHECDRLREERVELSSAREAVDVLFKALGWSSGGLGSAAIEIVKQRDELEKKLQGGS